MCLNLCQAWNTMSVLCAWLDRVLLAADPAACVPGAIRTWLVNALVASGVISTTPFLGGEPSPGDLLPVKVACPCEHSIHPRPSLAAKAILIDVDRIVEKNHIPHRCNNKKCNLFGSLQWHNYYTKSGQHLFFGSLQILPPERRLGICIFDRCCQDAFVV